MAICMTFSLVLAGSGGAETAAVLPRADAEGTDEGAPHRLRRAVAAGAGGLFHPVRGVLQAAPGRLEPDLVDIASRRHAHLSREGPGERARRQAGLVCQRLDRQ